MRLLPRPGARVLTILALWLLCAVAAGLACWSTGRSYPGEGPQLDVLLECIGTALFVAGPGFVLLAVAARWMSLVAVAVTLMAMAVLSARVSLDMWNASNGLAGLDVLLLVLVLPIAGVGIVLDIGGRALARRLRPARGAPLRTAPRSARRRP